MRESKSLMHSREKGAEPELTWQLPKLKDDDAILQRKQKREKVKDSSSIHVQAGRPEASQ